MTGILLLISAIAVILLVGFLSAALFSCAVRERPAGLLAVSFGLGTGIMSLELFAVSWAGARLNSASVGLLAACDMLILLFFARRKALVLLKAAVRTKIAAPDWMEIVLSVLILLASAGMFFDALSLPLHSVDAVSIWSYKAKIIYGETLGHTGYFSERARSYSHPDYPLLVPLMQAYAYSALGRTDDRLARVLFPLYFIFLLLAVYAAQRRFAPRIYSLLFTAALATLPVFLSEAVSGYADVPLAFYCFIMVSYLYLWMKEGDAGYLALSAIFSGLAMFTKNEGTGLFLANSVVFLVFIAANPGKANVKRFSVYLAAALLVIIPWILFRRHITVVQEDYFSRLSPMNAIRNMDRFPAILLGFAGEFISINRWNIFWLVFAGSIIAGFRRIFRSPAVYPLLFIFLVMGMYALIYIVTPWEVKVLMNFTLSRLLIHLAPLAALFACEQYMRWLKVEG